MKGIYKPTKEMYDLKWSIIQSDNHPSKLYVSIVGL